MPDETNKPPALKASWKRWHMGWGETMRLGPNLEMTAYKGTSRDDKFVWEVFGNRCKNQCETMEAAKKTAEAAARRLLTEALSKLPDAV